MFLTENVELPEPAFAKGRLQAALRASVKTRDESVGRGA